jgi:predicted amidohydrolase
VELSRRQGLAAALAAALPLPAEGKPMTDASSSYIAMAFQLAARSVERMTQRAEVETQFGAMTAEVATKLRGARAFIEGYAGAPLRLIVLPEYLFTSYPTRISIPDFARLAAIAPDGPEYDALGRLASDARLFVAGNAYETDRNFPDLYFQTSFVVAPSGEVVLRYRRLNSMFAPTPHDVWSKYLDVYGLDGVFPVARTEIGNLAAIASEEILYPEIARAHALRGAEIFLHSSSEIGSPQETHKAIARRARAFENLAYVVSANTAGIAGTALPLASADGNSAVVDYKGAVLAESNSGETFTAFGEIDLAGLRRARRKPGMTNYLARTRTELFAPAYAATTVQPANSLIENGVVRTPDRDHFRRVQERVIERLSKDGLI